MFKWIYDFTHGPDPYPVAMGKVVLVILVGLVVIIGSVAMVVRLLS